MTTGREGLLRTIRATTGKPLRTDDIYIQPHAIAAQPLDELPRVSAFCLTIELYQVLAPIVAEHHSTSPSSPAAHVARLQTMLALDAELESWLAKLPEPYNLGVVHHHSEPWIERHRHVLYTRCAGVRRIYRAPVDVAHSYLNTRLLLFRASIMRSPAQLGPDSFRESVSRIAASTCLDAAYRQVTACTFNTDSLRGVPFWYHLFCARVPMLSRAHMPMTRRTDVYTACSVLLAARWNGTAVGEFESAWQRATDLLTRNGHTAAVRVLNVVLDRVSNSLGLGTDVMAELRQALGAEWQAFDGTLFGQMGPA
jgi:hypothetical protein